MQLSGSTGRMSFRISSELRVGPGQYLAGLRDDDSLLRQVFFSILRHHHPNLASKVNFESITPYTDWQMWIARTKRAGAAVEAGMHRAVGFGTWVLFRTAAALCGNLLSKQILICV